MTLEIAADILGVKKKAEQDKALDEASINQLTWKQKVSCIVRCRILEAALNVNSTDLCADDIKQDDLLPQDKNVVGISFRILAKQGMLAPKMSSEGQVTRKSSRKETNGRRVSVWKLGNAPLAQAYLKRYGSVRFESQQQLL